MIYIWFIAAVSGFLLTSFFRQWNDSDVLILVSIGAAINANIFNAETMPAVLHGFVFGIDSILYTLFLFTVYLKARASDIKKAKSMTITTIQAILISALIEFFARTIHNGCFSTPVLILFLNYVVSSISTVLCVWIMLFVFKKLKSVNKCLHYFICLFIADLLNTMIYYLIVAIAEKKGLEVFYGSVIGKVICIFIGLIFFIMNEKFWKPDRFLKRKNAG